MRICYYLCDQARTRKSRGIWVYTEQLLKALVLDPDLDLLALTSRDGPQLAGVSNRVLPVCTSSIPMRLMVDQLHPATLPQADVYHYPKGFMPTCSPRRAPRIASVHDTIGAYYYEHYRGRNAIYRPFELEYWLGMLTRTLTQADAVITVSHVSAASIACYCDRRRIAAPPIFVTHLASRFTVPPPWTGGRAKPAHVLHLASDQPHKRTGWLLRIWKAGLAAGRDLPELRIAGPVGGPLRELAQSTRGVRLLPALNDAELQQAILAARALIYPSEVEGFGLPALEAYQLGTPAMYVAGTSVDEIMHAGGMHPPGRFKLDPDDFWRAFDEVMSIPTPLLTSIQQTMQATFSWGATARETVAIYQRVLESDAGSRRSGAAAAGAMPTATGHGCRPTVRKVVVHESA